MAVDSAEKRRGAMAYGLVWLGPGVTPNAAQDAEWRAQAMWNYPGIAVAAPPAAVVSAVAPFVYRRDKRLRTSKRGFIPGADALLLEEGGLILTEEGDKILKE